MDSVKERQTEEPQETVNETGALSKAGKRSDPNFVQISAYIPKETHRAVKRALLDLNEEKNLSELLAELLDGWVKARG